MLSNPTRSVMGKSFAALFSDSAKPSIVPKPIQRYIGSPMIEFSDEEITSLAAPNRFTLIGTLWYGRPPMATIRVNIDRSGFTQAWYMLDFLILRIFCCIFSRNRITSGVSHDKAGPLPVNTQGLPNGPLIAIPKLTFQFFRYR